MCFRRRGQGCPSGQPARRPPRNTRSWPPHDTGRWRWRGSARRERRTSLARRRQARRRRTQRRRQKLGLVCSHGGGAALRRHAYVSNENDDQDRRQPAERLQQQPVVWTPRNHGHHHLSSEAAFPYQFLNTSSRSVPEPRIDRFLNTSSRSVPQHLQSVNPLVTFSRVLEERARSTAGKAVDLGAGTRSSGERRESVPAAAPPTG